MKKGIRFKLLRQWFFHLKRQENKSLYRVIGMRRSGNHAFLNWMLAQMPGLTCLNNNQQNHPPENTPIKKAVWNGTGRYNLVVAHEDQPTEVALAPLTRNWYGGFQKQTDILILRDPYNWLASRYAWQEGLGARFRESEDYRQQLIALYKEYAALFEDWVQNPQEGRLPVNYNRWVIDGTYRQALAEKLELKFTDKGRDKVSVHGGGSSFDKLGYQGRGSEMPVLERWKQFKDDVFYWSLLDKELVGIGERVFGVNHIAP